MNLNLSYGTPEDAEALCALFMEYQRELDSIGMEYSIVAETLLSSILGKIRSRMALCAVAKDGDTLIGFLFCNIIRLSGYTYDSSSLCGFISETFVAKAYRGQGIAKSLCKMAFDWLQENGVSYIELKVLENNTNAHSFWKNQGFSPAARVYGKRILKTEE